MRRRFVILGAMAGVLTLVFSACGSGAKGSATATPRGGTAVANPTTPPTPPPYPLTLRDMLGRDVTLKAQPRSIAAISPTAVEYVYAVGGTSTTRTTSVTYPAEAKTAKDIGSAYQPNFELVAAQSPDLIVADSVLQAQLRTNLEALGVPVIFAGAGNFADVQTGLRLVGKAVGRPDAGEDIAGKMTKQLESLQKTLPAQRPKVLVLNGSPQDFYAAKPESYVGDLVGLLGATNVAKGQPDVGRFPGYTKLSLETILTSQPDVVLAITAGPPGGPTITQELSSNAAWKDVPAVKNGRVTEISAEVYLQAPGPRVADALTELNRLLYPTGGAGQ